MPFEETAMHVTSSDVAAASPAFFPRLLSEGWQCLSTPAGACLTPAALHAEGWLAAPVPGTIASAWEAAGKLDLEAPPPFAFEDHWYRLVLREEGARILRLHGLATLSEVWLNDTKLLDSDSMYIAHDVDLQLSGHDTVTLCFRSIKPLLDAKRSRARWRHRRHCATSARPCSAICPAGALRYSLRDPGGPSSCSADRRHRSTG
jgi:beta-mannosidase